MSHFNIYYLFCQHCVAELQNFQTIHCCGQMLSLLLFSQRCKFSCVRFVEKQAHKTYYMSI